MPFWYIVNSDMETSEREGDDRGYALTRAQRDHFEWSFKDVAEVKGFTCPITVMTDCQCPSTFEVTVF